MKDGEEVMTYLKDLIDPLGLDVFQRHRTINLCDANNLASRVKDASIAERKAHRETHHHDVGLCIA